MGNTVTQPRAKELDMPDLSIQSVTNTELLVHDKRSRQMFSSACLSKYVFFAFVFVDIQKAVYM